MNPKIKTLGSVLIETKGTPTASKYERSNSGACTGSVGNGPFAPVNNTVNPANNDTQCKI